MPSRPVTIVGIATWAEEGEPQPPLGIWGGGNVPFPEHPIVLPPVTPQPVPPEIWGGANEGFPQHPIFIPIVPPGGEPTHPIYIPVYPAHPIAPGGEAPDNTPPEPGDPDYPGYNPPSGGNVPAPIKK